MRRAMTILLSLVVLFAGLAQAFDVHDEPGCADTSNPTYEHSPSPARGDAPDRHASGCCFGSIVLTLPSTYALQAVTKVNHMSDLEIARPPAWQSDSPERPPRS